MKLIDVGTSPVGVIAIGANATGIIAIGALANGVIAIGQLARGVIVVGQLAIGVVCIGQLAIGVGWAAGQLGVAATSGPGIIFGLFGRLRLRKSAEPRWEPRPFRNASSWLTRVTVVSLLIALWWLAAGKWLADDLAHPPTPTNTTTTTITRPLR